MQKNMYKHSVKQWNPFSGCKFDCIYCESSFKRQLKRWGKKNCQKCYTYAPHTHPSRLTHSLPRTNSDQFIFTCSSGDIAFCSMAYLKRIIGRIEKDSDKMFLIQSKDPKTFSRVTFPDNVILGTTIETNRDIYNISRAPKPSRRYREFLKVKHPRKMITIEPILDFDQKELVSWIKEINPCMVWLGYDSGKNGLIEPSFEKFTKLYQKLSKDKFNVILKNTKGVKL